MAVKTIEELTASIRQRIGSDTSDEALGLLEDIDDTMNDINNRLQLDGTDWKKRFEENDTMWRKRYRDRFNSPVEIDNIASPADVDDKPKSYKYDNLFKEGE